jgi:hypothetical protein
MMQNRTTSTSLFPNYCGVIWVNSGVAACFLAKKYFYRSKAADEEFCIDASCYLNSLLGAGLLFRYNIQDLQGLQHSNRQVKVKLSYNLETIAGKYRDGIDHCWATAC